MMKRHTPPGRTSISWIVFRKPFGPHQWATCLGSVHIRQTSSRGASKTRVATISFCAAFATAMFLLLLFFLFELAQVLVQAVEARFPEFAVVPDPVGDLLERRRLEVAGSPLRVAAAGDQSGALEHLQMLGDGRETHVEGLG